MPVLPSEDNAPSNLTETLAKDPSSQTESTASEAEGHANENNPLGTCPSYPFVLQPAINASLSVNTSLMYYFILSLKKKTRRNNERWNAVLIPS